MGKEALAKMKFLTCILTISLTFNVFFIAFFLFEGFQGFKLYSPVPKTFFEKKEATAPFLLSLKQAKEFCDSEDEKGLFALLKDKNALELGYKMRDMALSCLVENFDFDYQKVLFARQFSLREIAVEDKKIILFKDLEEEDFEALWHFAETECYPFTSYGLFKRIERGDRSKNLLEVFTASPPFLAFFHLFNEPNWQEKPSSQFLLEMVFQGPYSLLENLMILQKKGDLFSADLRRAVLTEYLRKGSLNAALFFVTFEKEYALKNMQDEDLLLILGKIPLSDENGKAVAIELLSQPRGDKVWKKASSYLYESTGEVAPLPFSHHAALKQFLPNSSEVSVEPVLLKPSSSLQPLPEKIIPTPLSKEEKVKVSSGPAFKTKGSKPKLYIVQTGDSLWKIARRFHTEVEILKAMNHLQTDSLKPGSSLLVP